MSMGKIRVYLNNAGGSDGVTRNSMHDGAVIG